MEFSVSMRFTDHLAFKEAVKQYGIEKKFNVWFSKNSSKKVQAKCELGCPWSIWASEVRGEKTFAVKSYNNEQKCTNKQKNRQVNAKFLARQYFERIKAFPWWKLSEFQWQVKEDFEVNVSLSQCYRARGIALKKAYASIDELYSPLWDYANELKRTNIGSTIEIKVIRKSPGEKSRFLRMYIGFDSLKKGWLAGCRKIIGMDGCFLKGICKGELLCAIGRDANNQMFPLAWAVVEVENTDS